MNYPSRTITKLLNKNCHLMKPVYKSTQIQTIQIEFNSQVKTIDQFESELTSGSIFCNIMNFSFSNE